MARMHRFGCVILVDRRGWILLQERDEHPAIDPEKWGLVGGHLDDGEAYDVGAARELEEETGVRLRPDELTLWRQHETFHEAYGTVDPIRVFVAPTDLSDADIVLGEGRQIVFVEPTVARTLPRTVSATSLVPDFLDSDLYRSLCP